MSFNLAFMKDIRVQYFDKIAFYDACRIFFLIYNSLFSMYTQRLCSFFSLEIIFWLLEPLEKQALGFCYSLGD